MPTTVQDHRQPAPRWAELGAALVEERLPGRGNGVVAVVCPAVHRVLPRPLRHTACCAVFRTEPNAVWMLRTVGYEWTEERLAAAVEVVARKLGHLPARRDPLLAVRLARALQVPQVQVLAAALDPPDPGQWETRRLALAARLQYLPPGERGPDPAALALDIDEIERALIARLGEALRRFAHSLDEDVLAAAPDAARDIELYDYLADPIHRRNRLQLASTFPLFLRAAVSSGGSGAGGLIRRVVDDGVPLVRTLAAQWAVSPSVLRGLRGRPVETIGAQWQANIAALVTVLNALPAEFRPGADAAAWRAFNDHVSFAESAFGRRPWTSPLALAWLRQAARRGWTAETIAEADHDLQQASIALVDQLRQALIEALKAEGTLPTRTTVDAAALSARAWHEADRVLAGMAPKRLIALAQRYRRELAVAQGEHASEIATARGARFWPLLPGEVLSGDRSRLVVPLDSRQALLAHGRAVVNCLGGSHLNHYAAACGRGDAFILGVLEAGSRRPLSTAEVRAQRLTLIGRTEVRLVQHTAAHNAAPSRACRDAVAEAVALLGTAGGQDHLRRGARALAARRRGDAQLLREFDLLPVRQAVRATIGDRRFDELAAAFRQASGG
jgi:hypothetical protein